MIEPVKVQVNNGNQEAAELAGALLGALAGSRKDSGAEDKPWLAQR